MAKRAKKPLEAPQGRYFALPHGLLDSQAWIDCSPQAKALLMDMCRQHSGINNGRMHFCNSWLIKRGWKRHATVRKLRDELLNMRLILQTRHGGLNNGANWFALTWLQVTDFSDLNISPQTYHPGLYLLAPLPKSEKEKKPRTAYVREKATARTAHVLVQASPRTAHVREKALITDSPRTAHVHNEYIPIPNASNIVEVIL